MFFRLAARMARILPVLVGLIWMASAHGAAAQSCTPSGAYTSNTFHDGFRLCAADLNANNAFLEALITAQQANSIIYLPGYTGAVSSTVQQGLDGTVDINMFLTATQVSQISAGTYSGDVTAAKALADAAVVVTSSSPYGTGHGGEKWHHGIYPFAATLHQRVAVKYMGESGIGAAPGSTVWSFPANITDIYIEAANETNCASGATSTSGSGTTFDGITIQSATGTLDPTGVEAGIFACSTFHMRSGQILYAAGDLIHIDVTGGGVADTDQINGVDLLGFNANTRHAMFFKGIDANTATVTGVIMTNVAGSCVDDEDSIGNTFVGTVAESCGFAPTKIFANQGGVSYLCLTSVQSGTTCKNTTPGTNGAIWGAVAFNAGYSAYSASNTYFAGPEYNCNSSAAHCTFVAPYSEGGDPPSNISGGSMVLAGGNMGSGFMPGVPQSVLNVNTGDGGFLYSASGIGSTMFNASGVSYSEAVLGGGAFGVGDLLRFVLDSTPDNFRFHWQGSDIRQDWNEGDSTVSLFFTSPNTGQTFGTGSFQAYRLFAPRGIEIGDGFTGWGSDGRLVQLCSGAAPSANLHAQGEMCINKSVAACGDIPFWMASATGTPGTWLAADGLCGYSTNAVLTTPTVSGLLTNTQATANTAAVSSSGGSLTGSNATTLWNFAGTWNTTGTPDALAVHITNTASNAASNILNLYGGTGGATSEFSVTAGGSVAAAGSMTASANVGVGVSNFLVWGSTTKVAAIAGNGTVSVYNNAQTNAVIFGTQCVVATPCFQLGAADAAAPVAQTIQVQSVVAGTSNTAGANMSIQGSKGTGTGVGGNIALKICPAGTTGTTQNACSASLTINPDKTVQINNTFTVSTLPTCNAGEKGALAVVSDATTPTYNATLTGAGAVVVPVFCNGTAWTSH